MPGIRLGEACRQCDSGLMRREHPNSPSLAEHDAKPPTAPWFSVQSRENRRRSGVWALYGINIAIGCGADKTLTEKIIRIARVA
jgi:hypothetical protein